MDLETRIEQYKNLKTIRDQLDIRLKELNKKIKDEMQEKEIINLSVEVGDKKLLAYLIERNQTSYDQYMLLNLLKCKGLYSCIREIPDEQLVEGAYLEGKLTDDDLREIRKPNYTIALHVDDV